MLPLVQSILTIQSIAHFAKGPKHQKFTRIGHYKGYGAKKYGRPNKHAQFVPQPDKMPTLSVPEDWTTSPLQPYVAHSSPKFKYQPPSTLPPENIKDFLMNLKPPYRFSEQSVYDKVYSSSQYVKMSDLDGPPVPKPKESNN